MGAHAPGELPVGGQHLLHQGLRTDAGLHALLGVYIGLFAGCGAVVVAVSYTQVARLPAQLPAQGQGQGKGGGAAPGDLAGFAAQCRSAEQSARPDPGILAKCAAYFQQQGAQGQRSLTLSHLLQYSLITLAVVVALAAILGWIFAGRAVLAERLIANLVDNAIRYNRPDGEVWVGTRAVAGRRELVVANTGPVVDPGDVGRIFQPFERLSDRTSRDGFEEGGLSVTVTIPSPVTAEITETVLL